MPANTPRMGGLCAREHQCTEKEIRQTSSGGPAGGLASFENCSAGRGHAELERYRDSGDVGNGGSEKDTADCKCIGDRTPPKEPRISSGKGDPHSVNDQPVRDHIGGESGGGVSG